MPIATMNFKVDDPDQYESMLHEVSNTMCPQKDQKIIEWNQKLEEAQNRFKCKTLSAERVNGSERFQVMVAFDDLNLFIESMMWYRENMSKHTGYDVDMDIKVNVFMDTDNTGVDKKQKVVMTILDDVCTDMTKFYTETQSIYEIYDRYKGTYPDSMKEELKSKIEGRKKWVHQMLQKIQMALHSLMLIEEKPTIN